MKGRRKTGPIKDVVDHKRTPGYRQSRRPMDKRIEQVLGPIPRKLAVGGLCVGLENDAENCTKSRLQDSPQQSQTKSFNKEAKCILTRVSTGSVNGETYINDRGHIFFDRSCVINAVIGNIR